ncbi:MAG: hypothetical protein K2N14_05145, partial [Clostridia bacterium]|nr:hypothetical protein [Clostridia bacterium]
ECEKQPLALQLSVCSHSYVHDLFLMALEGAYFGFNRIEDDDYIYFFNFNLSPLSPDAIAEIIKVETDKKKCVFCCEASLSALSFAEDFNITILNIAHVYALLKDKNLLPEKYALGNAKKPNIFKRIKKRFNRKLCPPLFFCGLSLLFFSFFTYYPVYYVVFGGLLLILSAASILINAS